MLRKAAILFATACLVAIESGCASAPKDSAAAPSFPRFSATELNGERFELSQEKGRVVALVFFATWCDACRSEFPLLRSLYGKLHAKGLEILAVSADSPHDRGKVRKFLEPYPFPAALLRDALTNDFGTPRELPMLYLIGRKGRVLDRLSAAEIPEIKEKIEQAL